VDLKPSGNHRAELVHFVLLDLGFVFQVWLARTKMILCSSGADLLSRSVALLLLAMCVTSERRGDAFGRRDEMDSEQQSKDARTWNEATDK